MATKKSVKFALKYTLGSAEMECGSCREELALVLKDVGLAMRERNDQSFTMVTKDGHLQYKQEATTHSGPPVRKERKKKSETEGSEPEAEEDEA